MVATGENYYCLEPLLFTFTGQQHGATGLVGLNS